MPGDVFTAPPHALDRCGIDGARPGEPLGDAGAEIRIVRIDPGAVPAPDFVALQDAEDFRPFRRIAGVNADFLIVREHRLEPRYAGSERGGNLLSRERKGVLRDQQTPRLEIGHRQQHVADAPHGLHIPRKPSDRIETRGEIDDAVGRNEAVRGSDAVDAAIACRQPHRTAAIGAERKVDEAARDRGRRSARRAAGNPSRRVRIDRRAVMRVFAVEAVSQFVGLGFADHSRAGGKEALD